LFEIRNGRLPFLLQRLHRLLNGSGGIVLGAARCYGIDEDRRHLLDATRSFDSGRSSI